MEEKVLEYIKTYIEHVGFPPTFRDIADGCGISSISTVSWHLDKLVAAGKITKKNNVPRSIVVI